MNCQCDRCSMHYLNVRIKKGEFFFSRSGVSSPTVGKFGSPLPGTDLGQCRALSQQRSSPGAAGSYSGEARYKQETRRSFADRGWRAVFIYRVRQGGHLQLTSGKGQVCQL